MRITLPRWFAEILRLVAMVEMLAKRHEQVAVVSLRDAAAIVIARRQLALLPEYDLDVLKPILTQCGACNGGSPAAFRPLREAEIEGLVARERLVQHNVQQPALTGGPNFGHVLERRRQIAVAANDTKAPGPFRDQYPPVRQQGEPPRMDEAAGNG